MAKKRKPRKVKKVKSLHELRILALRRASMRWLFKYRVLNDAKVYIDIGEFKNGKPKTGVFFICAECSKSGKEVYHKRNEVQVDHIVEISGTDGFAGWDEFIPRLFCEAKDLQVLCKPHHLAKTAKHMQIINVKNKIKANKKLDKPPK